MDLEYLRNALTILRASQRLFVPRDTFLGMFRGGKSDLNATLLAEQYGCRLAEESKGFYFVKTRPMAASTAFKKLVIG